jgi:hypothetical protein
MNALNTYLNDLQFSTLALPEWAVFLFWLVLFVGSHLLHLQCHALLRKQAHIALAESARARPYSLPLVGVQIAYALAIFIGSDWLGHASFVFLAGGWVVHTAVSFAANVQSTLFLIALTKPGAAEGAVQYSARQTARDSAYQMLGGATLCLCTGVLLAHLALLGGALFLAAAGVGYLRKA